MEANMAFRMEDVDEISRMSTCHFSFITQNLIPKSVVGFHRIEAFDNSFEENQELSALNDDDVTALPVGSAAEGLNMPRITQITKGYHKPLDLSDLDIMLVLSQYNITFDEEEKSSLRFADPKELFPWEFFALAETSNIHPGYVRLNRSNTKLLNEYQDREMLLLNFRMHTMERKEFVDVVEINGPALTIPVFASDRNIGGKPLPVDKVLAMPCNKWPPTARSWIGRSKEKGWLQENLIQEIVKDGCHIVPANHRQVSKMKSKSEWRISFASAERKIAREALSDVQRQAYIVIKTVYHQRLKNLEIISSYHLKTVFFYTCERIHGTCWEENVGSCILYFLDILIECAEKGKIPNFFIPENNLIDYLTEEELAKLLESLNEIRQNPVEQLLLFFDDKYIEEIGGNVSFRFLFKPVFEDMENYLQHRNYNISVKRAFKPFLEKMLATFLEARNYREAVRTGEALHSLQNKCGMTEETLDRFFLSAIPEMISEEDVMIGFFSYLTNLYQNDESFVCCRNHLTYLLSAVEEVSVSSEDWTLCQIV